MTGGGTYEEGLVSVVLPTLDGSRYIHSSIESCLAQTYGGFELIVVDGGSSDGTLEIVESFADPRVRLVHQPGNAGRLSGALNRGFADARGVYFTWTQDDDLFAPEALAVMVEGLERRPDAGMVYAGQVFIDDEGTLIRPSLDFEPHDLTWTNPIGHCFLYRREVAESVGLYDPAFLMAEDTHYWMRVYRQSTIVRLPGRYFDHRLHDGNLTGRNYGAYVALRVSARARRAVLGIAPHEARRQIAAAYVEEGYAAYARGDFGHVRACLARAARRRPRCLAERGVLLLGARSLGKSVLGHAGSPRVHASAKGTR